ncbi:ROK family protein [Pseudoduganella sp. UC29_106]|uniref:ROK family transcriptional regulator n=1 Tax=Pseudoduganella sp. UC29_106 TaxID=3374553 RepID=UPI0037578B2C
MRAARLHLVSEEKRLLRHLRTKGPMPRTELALALQVSNSALTKLSHNLISLGLIEEQASTEPPVRGRPTVPLAISPSGGFAAGATVHKGVLEIALVDLAGGVICLTSEQVGAPDPIEFANILEDRINELCVKHKLLGVRFLGIGVGVPGPAVSRKGDRWHIVKELPGWRDVPCARSWTRRSARRSCWKTTPRRPPWPSTIRTAKSARPPRSWSFSLGTAIGAGVIEDGHLVKGEFGSAGDIGRLYPSDLPRPTTMDLLSVLQQAGCPIESVARFDELTAGYEDVIDQWLDRAAVQLEFLVNSAIGWFDPDEIVISSPLPESITSRLAARLNALPLRWPSYRERGQVRVSKLGGSAIAIGAALLPIHAATALLA